MDKSECRIILVDDHPVILDIEKNALEQEGYRNISCFSNPFEAKMHLDENKAHVIVSDLNMPEMSGFALLSSIAGVPVKILVSASESEIGQLRPMCEQQNIITILKPFSSEMFVGCIDRALQVSGGGDNG